MVKIAVLIDEGFQDTEYFDTVTALKKKGHKVINIGIEKKLLTGKNNKIKAQIDEEIKKVQAKDFQVLFIPGGFSPETLSKNADILNFVKKFDQEKKLIFVICAGPQVLIKAKILKGRKITGHSSIAQDLIDAGAIFIDKKVVIDDNIVSSRCPDDVPFFIEECLKKLNTQF